MTQPHVIVLGNEKGGAGKSTLAIHIVTGLLHAGRSVAIIDLDLRQRSMQRFFQNRAAWLAANGHELPQPFVPDMGDGKALAKADEAEQLARFDGAYAEAQAVVAQEGHRFLEQPLEDSLEFFREYGCRMLLDRIREDLEAFGVRFDVWFSTGKLG